MKIVRITLLILVIILGILLFINKKNIPQTSNNNIKLSFKDKSININYNFLQKLPHQEIFDREGNKFNGIKLTNIIKIIKKDNIKQIECISKDGMSVKLKNFDTSYLVLYKDFYRLVIPTDEFRQRWLKYITEIRIYDE